MLWLILIVLFILIVLLVFLWFIRIYVKISYSWKDKEQEAFVQVHLAKIKVIQKQIPFNQTVDPSIMENLDEKLDIKLNPVVKKTRKILEALQKIMSQTKLHELNWSTIIGTGEASSTGVASGLVWTVKGTIIGYIVEKLIVIKQPAIQVDPKFQEADFQTDFDCMVSIRLGKAIQGMIKLTRILKAK